MAYRRQRWQERFQEKLLLYVVPRRGGVIMDRAFSLNRFIVKSRY